MKHQNIDITRFTTLEELHNFVEENAFQLQHNSDITNLYVLYRGQTKDAEEKQKAQWEIECFLFHIVGDKVFSFSYSTGSSIGEIATYPSLDQFQRDAFEYISLRARTTKSPLIRARYHHLLWKGLPGIKNREHALAAMPDYISCIHVYYNLSVTEQDTENYFQLARMFEIIGSLCNEAGKGYEELRTLTKFILLEATGIPFYCKDGIISDMMKYPKIFKAADFTGTLSIYEEELKKKRTKSDDFLQTTTYLPHAIEVSQKTKADVTRWYDEIGFAQLRIAEKETAEDRNWLKLNMYVKAIQAFGRAGNKQKKKETEQLYAALKPAVKLPVIDVTPNKKIISQMEVFHKHVIAKADAILQEDPGYIYAFISEGSFFPKYQDVVDASKNTLSSMAFVTTVLFDRQKNIARSGEADVQSIKFQRFYALYINQNASLFLHSVFIKGISTGHLNYHNLISFLKDHSWVGKPREHMDLGGQVQQTNWLALLVPSIVEFFSQVQAGTSSKYCQPSFVLCIDSLALKLEGLLRDFCERINIGTSIGRPKSMQEMHISDLLDNTELKQYFDEDDMLFFRFLLTSDGPNVRNNVAHCFYDASDYSVNMMLLLIAALLRIAKYKVVEEK